MDELVWMSTLRKGLAYHRRQGRLTVCGRFVGEGSDPARGYLMSLDRAAKEYEARPCAACLGYDRVEPRRA